MLSQRLIVAIILIPLGVLVAAFGGWLLAAVVTLVLAYGAWEYWQIYRTGGFHPSLGVLVLGTVGLALTRYLFDFTNSGLLIALIVLGAMGVHVFHFERGDQASAVDFNLTVGGALYLGWLGSYLISLRALPAGAWWFLVVLPAIWSADGAAYFVGSHFGRHKMSPRVSPNKSWEGYFGGVVAGALSGMLFASLWHMRAPMVTPERGLLIGLAIAVIAPLGDLGESMLKRGFGVKDSSHLLPGHGGVMDRIDSWLWAVPIGYYLILLMLA